MRQRAIKNLRVFFHRIFGKKSPLKSLSSRLLIDLLLFAGLVYSVYTILQLRHHISELEGRYGRIQFGRAEEIATFDEELTISSPRPGAMVRSNRFDIEGEASDDQIISLSSEGKLLSVTMVKNGSFSFTDVKAKRGKNSFVVRAITDSGTVTTLEKIEFTYGLPTPSYLTRSFDRGSTDFPQIALTFDAGSVNNAADDILNTLKEYNIRCTMFLTGQFILHYPETVQRMVDEGHEIGNHTWSHPHLTTFAENGRHETRSEISAELLKEELLSTAELFRSTVKKEMVKLWRAPYGEHNREIRNWAAELGYRQVGWTLGKDWEHSMDTLDWVADKNSSAYYSAEEILEKITNFGNGDATSANGAIILMHLGTQRVDDFPHELLPQIITRMSEKGYTFVTISSLM